MKLRRHSVFGAVGGFSNSDVLGSAKVGQEHFYTMQKQIQLLKISLKEKTPYPLEYVMVVNYLMELELINPEHTSHGKMLHNDSQKHESAFTSVKVQENNSVMLSSLAGSTLGVWISHGEGKFNLPEVKKTITLLPNMVMTAIHQIQMVLILIQQCFVIKRDDILVMMPHIERSTFQWNWANYPKGRKDEVSPWLEAFVNAKNWVDSINQ